MSKRKRLQRSLEFIINICSLAAAHGLSLLVFKVIFNKINSYSRYDCIEYAVILFISAVLVFFCFSALLNLEIRSRAKEFTITLRNCAITYALFGALLILTKNELLDSRYLFLSSMFFYLITSLGGRYIVKHYLLSNISKSGLATNTGVISTYERAVKFVPELRLDWSKNIKSVALLDAEFKDNGFVLKDGTPVSEIYGVPVVANNDSFIGWIRTASLDEVYINISEIETLSKMSPLIEELEDMGITVHINIPTLEDLAESSKYENISCVISAGYPMATFSPTQIDPDLLVIKRIVDIIGSIVGIILSLPVILITAIPLKLESPGPLIFKQPRVGRNGRIFNIYKLRSMYADAEERKKALMEQNFMDGNMFKMDNDPRITKVGKFIRKTSIDELPQFWNVLKGDMSLVGTRPPTVDEFEKYESHHKRRLSMKPGITGKWQVSGRSEIRNFEEVVKLDCEYIDEWSLALDAKILLKTVGVVLLHKGAE